MQLVNGDIADLIPCGPNVVIERLTPLLRIREVPGSDLDPEAG
jgi:hypothetical protein